MFVTAIIAAGGRGIRLGGGQPKQLRRLGPRTLLEWSLDSFDRSEVVNEIVVVLPAPVAADPPPFLTGRRTPVRVVPGGARRQDSVGAGLDSSSPEAEVVVVHDAARPFCSPELIQRTVSAAAETGAAIAALPARDTVKRGRAGPDVTLVVATLPRDEVFLAQTPQAFRRDVLATAVAAGRDGLEVTDEAALVEHLGHPVRLVPGDPRNMKITTEADLVMARGLIDTGSHGGTRTRVGLGYDLHRLVEGRSLVLGGAEIPGDRGLLGHSDADVVCHAVTDAILGAAGADDIGGLFPDTDDRWKGASSLDLLRRAAGVVRERGFEVVNVDIVVITDWPKIRSYASDLKRNLGDAMGVSPDRVGVKGKTSEGVGALGRGEAIAVHAMALVERVG